MFIALTGGIGAGKSVVARLLPTMGYAVFDCDIEARMLMDGDDDIKARIGAEIAADAIDDQGAIDRARLSEIVFSDAEKLASLNAVVHGAVKERLARWCERQDKRPVFVETAILYQSGLNRMVDAEWSVEAPVEIRVARVMARNGISRRQVMARIEAQHYTPADGEPMPETHIIENDGITPLLPQVLGLLRQAQL